MAQAASTASPQEPAMKSTIGRPRKLTDGDVKVIRSLGWRQRGKELKSPRQLAREFGVSQSTISRVIRTAGY